MFCNLRNRKERYLANTMHHPANLNDRNITVRDNKDILNVS
jgi:hypothetical protein